MDEGSTKDKRRKSERKGISQDDSLVGTSEVNVTRIYIMEKNKNFSFKQINELIENSF